jgi:hypothetical protein
VGKTTKRRALAACAVAVVAAAVAASTPAGAPAVATEAAATPEEIDARLITEIEADTLLPAGELGADAAAVALVLRRSGRRRQVLP